MKECFKCNIIKPLTEFYKHKGMADGYLNKCKDCTKLDVRSNYRKNIDHYKDYEKGRATLDHRVEARREYSKTEKGIIAHNEGRLRYNERNPKVKRASTIVGNAVRDGRLFKPDNCETCGSHGRLEGHHCDYDKPLDVMWLCVTCHNNWHKENGEGANKN